MNLKKVVSDKMILFKFQVIVNMLFMKQYLNVYIVTMVITLMKGNVKLVKIQIVLHVIKMIQLYVICVRVIIIKKNNLVVVLRIQNQKLK